MTFDRSHPRSMAAVMAALLCALTLLCALLCGCEPSTADQNEESTTEEIEETLEEDTREFSDDAAYQNKLNTAFVGATPLSADLLIYEVADDAVTLIGYTGDESIVVLPDEIDGKPVTAIGTEAFAGSEMKALSIPETVTRIEKGAFQGCDELATLRSPLCTGGTEPDSAYFGHLFGAKSYVSNAAAVPADLETVILTSPLSEIPDYAFYDCNDMTALGLPDTVTKIGHFAFASCSNLVVLSIGDSLKEIGRYAFESCQSLLSLELPSTVTSMGFGMLQGCAALESVTLPFVGQTREENTYFGYLFGASAYTLTEGFLPVSLMEVNLLDGCTSIPDNAFCFASCLRTVTVPKSCTTVGRRAFYGCVRLTEIDLSGAVSVGDAAFEGCISLSEVALGNNLASLGLQTFYDCAALGEIHLPDSLTVIPASCFDGCVALERVSWGPRLTSIGKNAFRRCDGLIGPDHTPSLDGVTVEDGNSVILPPATDGNN